METNNYLLEALKDIARLFNQADIKYCLIGGLAVGVLATPRATEDIDFLVFVDPSERSRIEDILKQTFLLIQSKEPVNLSFGKLWRLIIKRKNHKELIILDILTADSQELQDAIEAAFTIELSNVLIPVISRQDLIKMKSSSQRTKDRADAPGQEA